MKVSELKGTDLDRAVATALGVAGTKVMRSAITGPSLTHKTEWYEIDYPAYSTVWAVGGPLIQQHRIAVSPFEDGFAAMLWDNNGRGSDYIDAYVYEWDQQGPTPLIAAMRALVVSKFGEELPESA